MLPKPTVLKGLYFDIETAGSYETFDLLSSRNPKLASLWSKRCKWLRLNSGPDLLNASDSELWDHKASLHPVLKWRYSLKLIPYLIIRILRI